jgi:hypothetical protein
MRPLFSILVILMSTAPGCDVPDSLSGDNPVQGEDGMGETAAGTPVVMEVPSVWVPPFASEVVTFDPGEGSGFGEEELPGVVLGAPGPGTELQPSQDVLSLGMGGEIVLGFGDRVIVDGPGMDFAVHENAFWPGGVGENVFAELGEVAVSEDGDQWWAYPCSPEKGVIETYEGCAGWNPTLSFTLSEDVFLTWEDTGGDGFDLAESGFQRVRYIRIKDLSGGGLAPTAGFDLDGISLFFWNYDSTVVSMD